MTGSVKMFAAASTYAKGTNTMSSATARSERAMIEIEPRRVSMVTKSPDPHRAP